MANYTNSPLVQYVALTTKCNDRRSEDGIRYNPDGKIKKITIHHAAGRLSVETMGKMFSPDGKRKASSTYAIGVDGRIAMYVEEKNRPWTSSSAENDYQAVTIEVSNCNLDPDWEVSDLNLSRLIELCVDICKRNDIPRLEWTGDKSGSLTSHDMFTATLCPGPYLKSKFPYICEQVNKQLSDDAPADSEGDEPSSPPEITKGMKIELDNVNLYASSSATRRSSTKTGTFWIWGADVINGRVRITNAEDRVGVKGQVTGYINVSDVPSPAPETVEPDPEITETPEVPEIPETPDTTESPKDEVKEETKEEVKEEVKEEIKEETKKEDPVVVDPPKKDATTLAEEILKGKWGNGDDRKSRLRSAGYTDDEIKDAQSIVNSYYTSAPSISKGNRVNFLPTATHWATGQRIPRWVTMKTLYVRSEPKDGKCQVSTLSSGAITGVAYVKDLKKR